MKLLDRVRELLGRETPLAKDRLGAPADLEIRAAAAVLLLEAAYGDEAYVWKEERALLRGLERAFGIGRGETRALLARAEEIRPPVLTLADLTSVLAQRYDLDQRKQVLGLLWRVIQADGQVGPWEAAFVEHVTLALGLSAAQAAEARSAAR